jgi:hypothetical protein
MLDKHHLPRKLSCPILYLEVQDPSVKRWNKELNAFIGRRDGNHHPNDANLLFSSDYPIAGNTPENKYVLVAISIAYQSGFNCLNPLLRQFNHRYKNLPRR